MEIWVALGVFILFILMLISTCADFEYDVKIAEEKRKVQEQARINALEKVHCKACGAIVRVTQTCEYCGHKN